MRLSVQLNFLTLAVATTAASAMLCSCGANEKEVVFQSGGMTHTMTSGNAINISGLPVPIYPNAKPSGQVQASGDSDDSKFLMLASADKVEQISDFYNKELRSQGWQVSETVRQPGVINLAASKNDMESSVMISDNADGNTSITIAVGKITQGTPQMSGKVFTPDKLNPPTD
jgi:hypothetical protein